jgi:hypothetical protein
MFRWILSTVAAVAAALALMVMLVSIPQPSTYSCCEASQAAMSIESVHASPK